MQSQLALHAVMPVQVDGAARADAVLVLGADRDAARALAASLQPGPVPLRALGWSAALALRETLEDVPLAIGRLDVDGLAAARRLRAGAGRQPPLLFLCESLDDPLAEAALAVPATDLLPLRAPPALLRARIAAARREADLQRQLAESAWLRQHTTDALWRCVLDEPLPLAASEDEQIAHAYRHARLADCNEAMARLYGFPDSDAMRGLPIAAFLPPEDERSVAFLRAFVRSGYRLLDAESHERDAAGNELHLMNNLVAFPRDGVIREAFGATRDITALRSADLALRESEQRFRALAESMPQLVWIAGADGRLEWANRRWMELVGVDSLSEARTAGWDGIFHPDDRDRIFVAWRHAVATGEPYELELRLRDAAASSWRWHLCRGLPRRDGDGAIIQWIGTLTDIGAQKAAAAELQRAEARIRAVLDAAHDAVVVVDAEDRVREWNPQAEALFGRRRAQALGRRLRELVFPETRRGVHLRRLRRLFGSSDEGAPDSRRFEGIAIRSDGSEFACEITMTLAASIDGQLCSVFMRDVSEESRRLERERFLDRLTAGLNASLDLDEGLALLAELSVGSVADCCAIHLVEGGGLTLRVLRHVAPEAAAGPSAPTTAAVERVTASGAPLLFHEGGDVHPLPQAGDACAAARCTTMLLPMVAHGKVLGVLSWVLGDGERRYDGEDLAFAGEVARRAALAIDNALLYRQALAAHEETERALRELEMTNEELRQFAYVSSHDLQEPLRMVSLYIELLQQRLEPLLDEDARRHMRYAVEGAERMRDLIDDLLVYARIERGEAEHDAVDLQRPVRQAIDNLAARIAETGAAIRVGALPTVPGNLQQLTSLFQNLIANAITFARPGVPPEIAIDAERRATEWAITVCDHGIGISEEHFERIFEVFQRLHDRSAYPGTGIGLAICKKIVERHGGRIAVASRPGEGSVFTVLLPS